MKRLLLPCLVAAFLGAGTLILLPRHLGSPLSAQSKDPDVLVAAVGVPAALSNAGLMTMLQTAVDDRLRGRVFGAALTVMALVALCGTATCAALGDRLGPVTLLNIQGVGMLVGGLYVLRALRPAISGVTPATQRTSATAGRTA